MWKSSWKIFIIAKKIIHKKIAKLGKPQEIMISNIKIKHTIDNMIYTSDKVQNLKQFRRHLVNPFIKNGQYSHKTHFIGDNMEIERVLTMHKILFTFVF